MINHYKSWLSNTLINHTLTLTPSAFLQTSLLSAFFFLLLGVGNLYAQNGIIGSGFTNGWGTGDIISFDQGAVTTRIKTLNPRGTGDQFFRLVRNWSGDLNQFGPVGCVDADWTNPGVIYGATTCNTSGAFSINCPNTTDNYVFKTPNGNSSTDLLYFRVQGAVRSVSSVSQSPSAAAVAPNMPVTVTANLDGSLSTGQAVYLRYTTDAWGSSTVVQMSGSGTSYTAQIPGGSATNVRSYYVFTSGTANVASNGSNADLYTINFNNNGGTNYSYTIAAATNVVSVTSTGGTGATGAMYTTLNAAFTAINAGTHTGVINVTVTGNTTEPATAVPLLKSGGTSSYTAINIKPSGNVTVNSAATPTASKGIIILQGADNVTIDGDDPLTSGTQNMSFVVATNTTTGTAAIQLSSNSTTGTDGANSNIIKNCIITGGRSSATSTTVGYGIVMSDISGITIGAYSSLNTIIQNNTITRCQYGIYANGTSGTYPNTGLQILNNTIGSSTASSNIGFKAIYCTYTSTSASSGFAIIRGNDVRAGDVSISGSGYSQSITGIELGTVTAGTLIDRNNIHDILQPSTSGFGAYGIAITGSTNCDGISITNNFINNIVTSKYSSTSISMWTAYGIYYTAGATNQIINHNTIVLNQASTGSTANYYTYGIAATVNGVRIAQFNNNIIVNKNSSTNSCGFYTNGNNNIAAGIINNNNYYVPSGIIGVYSSSHTTLASWRTATSKDANAISVNPPFVSSTDLHLNTSGTGIASFFATGATGTGVTTDYDGATRAATPCIGADEFTLQALCANYTSPANAATGQTQTGVTLTWSAGTYATGYDVYFDQNASPTTLVSTNQAGLTYSTGTLLPSTTYYWKVVPKNSGTTASGCTTWSFTTQAAVPTLSTTPTSVAIGNVCVNSTSSASTFNLNALNLTGSSVSITAPSGFTVSEDNTTFTSSISVNHSSGSFTNKAIYVKFSPTASGAASGNVVISGAGLSSDVNVAVTGTGVNTAATATTGASSAVTASTATAAGSYVANCQTISAYGIEYSTTTGFANGTGTQVASTNQTSGSFTASLTGLNSSTVYYFKAYATYGATTVWGSQGTFTTACGVASVPWNEGFESLTTANTLPSCMTSSPTVASGGKTQTYIASATLTNSALIARTGSKFAAVYYSPNAAGYFFSAPIQLTGGVSYTASAFYKTDGVAWPTLGIKYGTTATIAGMTNSIASVSSGAATAYTEITGAFTPSSTGVYYIAFYADNTANNAPNYASFDDISLTVTPSCLAPTALTSSVTSTTTATLSWTAASPAPTSGYQYYVSTSATAPTAGTTPTASTAAGVTTANLTGLTANTTYFFWVRSNCGGADGTSTWAGSGTFFTGYCVPTNTNSGDYISSFSTSGGVLNINNSGTGTAALEDFTSQVVSQFASETVSFSGSYVGGSAGFSIWVDWNNDLIFEASERMFNASATAASWTGSFTIPAGQALGNYRMRIRAQWNTLSPPSCGAIGYGQAEDYTLSVVADTRVRSIASGDWNSSSTWNTSVVPTCSDNVVIMTSHTVTVNSASNVSSNLTVNSGGTLVVASGDLTVGCTLNNTPLTNNGTLTVSGGTLNINGNLSSALGSTFNQSGGNINIDGNNGGSTTGSVASGTPLLNLLQLNSGINWTGGTLTLVDPHTATTNTNGYAVFYNNATAGTNYPSANHTIQFGNGVSTNAGGHTSGFYINQWVATAYLPLGSIVVNGPIGTNRSVNYQWSPQYTQGNITVNSGGSLFGFGTFNVGGDLIVNSGGLFTLTDTTGNLTTAKLVSNTDSDATSDAISISQTIGGAGTFRNAATGSTASFTNLTINNTSAGGVTLSAPLSVSGTLTMTAGKINTTATNLLTLGTTTAAGTLSYTAGQIVGPFARTFATSSTTTAAYDATTLFPVGDGTNYTPIHIDPVNGAGPVVMRGQAFNTNSGSAGIGMASPLSNDRWEALATSGSSNLTSCFVGLNDAQIATGNVIAQSASAAGFYNAIAPVSTVAAGASIRTATAIPASSYTGFFTYGSPSVANTWTGTASNLWSTASNWSLSSVPTATDDVLISSNGSNAPVMDVDVTIPAGKSLTLTGGTLTIAPGKVLTIAGTANFGGMPVTFKSDATATAMLGPLTTGTLTGATNVTVERYLPAKRAWRLLTAPLKGSSSNTIGANWQGTANEGLLLFSPATYQTQTMTGYTTGGSSPNIWKYNSANTQWQSIPAISTENLFSSTVNNGFLVFATGSHGSNTIASSTTAEATTLKPKGQLITGSVDHTLTANKYHLLGNPYASPINTQTMVQANTGTTIYMVDPTLGTYGGYVAFDGSNWTPSVSGSDQYLQSGQGFFLKSTAGGAFTIAESHKASGNSNTWFERTATDTSVDKIRVLLYKQINNTWQLADGILAVNSASGNHDLDATDVGKMSNFNENLLFKNGTSNLAIEYRGLPAAGTLQPLQLTGTSAQGYELRIHTENYSNSNLTPYLENTQTGALTAIPTDGTALVVPFTGIAATSAAPDSRFRIVYQGPLSADDMNSLVVGVYPNPVQEGLFTIELTNTNAPASYSLTNLLGQEVQKGTLMSLTNAIPVHDLSEGVYLLQINQEGKRFTTKLMIK